MKYTFTVILPNPWSNPTNMNPMQEGCTTPNLQLMKIGTSHVNAKYFGK